MTYPEFDRAWHTQPTNSPIPDRNHPQNTDIPTLLKQLQPTDKTFPVPLNIRALEGETDTSPIAFRVLYPTISSNLPRRYRNSRNSQRPRIQAINSATQKSTAKTAHRLNFALLSLLRCAFVFLPQTRRHSNGNSYRLDYRYTAGIAVNRFSGGWRGFVGCGTGLDWGDWFVILGRTRQCRFPTDILQKRAIDQKQMRTNPLTYNTISRYAITEPPKDSLKPCPSQKRPPPKPTLKSTSATPNTTSTENKAG